MARILEGSVDLKWHVCSCAIPSAIKSQQRLYLLQNSMIIWSLYGSFLSFQFTSVIRRPTRKFYANAGVKWRRCLGGVLSMAGATSALFIMDIKGRCLISRDYRGDVSPIQAEKFFNKFVEKEVRITPHSKRARFLWSIYGMRITEENECEWLHVVFVSRDVLFLLRFDFRISITCILSFLFKFWVK